jgi:hypothetical protein
MNSTLEIHSTMPVVATNDIESSIAYGTNVPGFSFDFKYGDPPVIFARQYVVREIKGYHLKFAQPWIF